MPGRSNSRTRNRRTAEIYNDHFDIRSASGGFDILRLKREGRVGIAHRREHKTTKFTKGTKEKRY
jgi:hypothetical protein